MSRAISLSQGKQAIVDDADFEWLSQFKWSYHESAADKPAYAVRQSRKNEPGHEKRHKVRMHVAIMTLGDEKPVGMGVDHADGDSLNNSRSNLRWSTSQQNSFNRKKHRNNVSGHTGVHWHKRDSKWAAYIMVYGRQNHLGYFTDLEDAIAARKTAEKKYFGDFVRETA